MENNENIEKRPLNEEEQKTMEKVRQGLARQLYFAEGNFKKIEFMLDFDAEFEYQQKLKFLKKELSKAQLELDDVNNRMEITIDQLAYGVIVKKPEIEEKSVEIPEEVIQKELKESPEEPTIEEEPNQPENEIPIM